MSTTDSVSLGGYQCTSCGCWVTWGTWHQCYGPGVPVVPLTWPSTTIQWPQPQAWDEERIKRIEERLAALEKAAAKPEIVIDHWEDPVL